MRFANSGGLEEAGGYLSELPARLVSHDPAPELIRNTVVGSPRPRASDERRLVACGGLGQPLEQLLAVAPERTHFIDRRNDDADLLH